MIIKKKNKVHKKNVFPRIFLVRPIQRVNEHYNWHVMPWDQNRHFCVVFFLQIGLNYYCLIVDSAVAFDRPILLCWS